MKKTYHIYLDLDTSSSDEILLDLMLKILPRKQRKQIIKKALLSTLLNEDFIKENLNKDEITVIKTLKENLNLNLNLSANKNEQEKDLPEIEIPEETITDDIIDLDKTIEKVKAKASETEDKKTKTNTEAEIKFKY